MNYLLLKRKKLKIIPYEKVFIWKYVKYNLIWIGIGHILAWRPTYMYRPAWKTNITQIKNKLQLYYFPSKNSKYIRYLVILDLSEIQTRLWNLTLTSYYFHKTFIRSFYLIFVSHSYFSFLSFETFFRNIHHDINIHIFLCLLLNNVMHHCATFNQC